MRQVQDLKNTVDTITVRCFKAEKHRIELLTATTKLLNRLALEGYPQRHTKDCHELIDKINREISR